MGKTTCASPGCNEPHELHHAYCKSHRREYDNIKNEAERRAAAEYGLSVVLFRELPYKVREPLQDKHRAQLQQRPIAPAAPLVMPPRIETVSEWLSTSDEATDTARAATAARTRRLLHQALVDDLKRIVPAHEQKRFSKIGTDGLRECTLTGVIDIYECKPTGTALEVVLAAIAQLHKYRYLIRAGGRVVGRLIAVGRAPLDAEVVEFIRSEGLQIEYMGLPA